MSSTSKTLLQPFIVKHSTQTIVLVMNRIYDVQECRTMNV